mgnify:CR=1 FL=1
MIVFLKFLLLAAFTAINLYFAYQNRSRGEYKLANMCAFCSGFSGAVALQLLLTLVGMK